MGPTQTQYAKESYMTLFKQIALMLSLFLFIILSVVLTLNFQSASKSVEERLYEDAKNTASSLSLSLGSANGDISMMSTMINANFDSGNYYYISLVDVEDKVLYERKQEFKQISVPQWFLNIVHLSAPLAQANVSAGWSQVGMLNVKSDLSYAYTQLYTIFKNLIITFSIITVLALIILNFLLAAILKPLKNIQKQAEAVGRNEFIFQENIPYTKEFRDVVVGINTMVSKVKAMFDKGNEELKRQKELEYIDKTTKLKNRKYLIDKLPQFLKIDASSKGGVNMLIALSGVIEANKSIGHNKVDALFVDIANIFKESVSAYEHAIVSRMNGTEFSLFLPDCLDEDALMIAENINTQVLQMISTCSLDTKQTFISIGLYEYNYTDSISKLLSSTDNALAKAKFSTKNIYLEKAEEIAQIMGKDEWRAIITDAIKHDLFHFTPWTAVDTKAKAVAHYVLTLTLKTAEGVSYNYGQFMAVANQIGLGDKIYQNALETLFKNPDNTLKASTCSLRLSHSFLLQEESYETMSKLFKHHTLPFKLILEIPDKLAHNNTVLVNNYKQLFDRYKIETGIFEFIGESQDYGYLQALRPKYIKAEADYFISKTHHELSSLRLITDTIGISLIATSVMDLETLEKLQENDIHIIQGRATELVELG